MYTIKFIEHKQNKKKQVLGTNTFQTVNCTYLQFFYTKHLQSETNVNVHLLLMPKFHLEYQIS